MLFCLIIFCFGVFTVLPAEAGFFSFLEKLLGNNEPSSFPQFQPANSQTIPLLSAVLNSDPEAGLGGGDITIVGQSALLSVVGPLGSIADIEEKTAQGQISIYVVQKGDNLSQIAKMFGVSVNTIIWANNLNRGDLIQPGQVLVILPVSGIRYEVKEGDTIESIAKKWKGSIEEIIQFNDFIPGQPLAVGTTIIIPNGEAPLPPSIPGSRLSPFRDGSGLEYVGYYLRPVVGGRKSQGLHGYNGVDLAVSCGTSILASASGDVIMVRSNGWNGGYGKFIIINHSNGTQTLYAHNSFNIVGVGWHVVRGQVIGYIGASGNATGCHIHFEVRGAKNPF